MHDFDFQSLVDLEQPQFERAQLLLYSIERSGHFSLVALKNWENPNGRNFDFIVVELECDGVPDQNPFGVEYREPLAFLVGQSDFVPMVWALRRDFPSLIHMNDAGENMPFCPCLYIENPRVINRSWTAGSFLKRIYWWMENSAMGLLHHADQAVEQFFFSSNYELVLPADVGSDFSGLPEAACIVHVVPRGDDGGTFFLSPISAEVDEQGKEKKAMENVFMLNSSPIVQGTIFPSPPNLARLIAILESNGLAAKDVLRNKIQSLVGQSGVEHIKEGTSTVILVRIPICRADGEVPERYQIKAFLHHEDPIRTGLKMGFLFVSPVDNKVYQDVPGNLGEQEDIELLPLDVLKLNSQEDFCYQSGISTHEADNLPQYTLIGVGALGSALLDVWERSGWSADVLIDKDHIKPHNLTRHTAEISYIGWPKVKACADRSNRCTGSGDKVIAVIDDVCTMRPDTKESICTTTLVLDVSTTLDYPRGASFDDELPRHCTLFVTPSGNDGVMLFEDAGRDIRLRSLEAQYYRAVINDPWGERHLIGHLGKFISGAGCRDISFRLPFSSILAHASTMADQVRFHARSAEGCIRIWQRNPISGSVDLVEITPKKELRIQFGEVSVFYDEGLVEKLNVLRASRLPVETGGILLGYIDFNIKSIFIVDALPAPPDSEETETSFQRGTEGVMASVDAAGSRTANIVNYIGEWHSHPTGVEANPSRLDVEQLAQLADVLSEDDLPAVQLIVGENGVNVIVGESIRG